MSKLVHLHTHGYGSLLDGKVDHKRVMKKLKELGMDSIALTDHGYLHGVFDFYEEAKKNDIHPVIGCEVYFTKNSRFEKSLDEYDNRYYHLLLLAKTQKGYENLNRIVSLASKEGEYYKPRVDYELLEEYSEGIIATSACLGGIVPQMLLLEGYDEALKHAKKHQEIFGKDNYFIELQYHGIDEQRAIMSDLIRIANDIEAEMIISNDVHYIEAEEAEVHDVMLCVQTKAKVDDEKRMRMDGTEYYLKSEDQMREAFRDFEDLFDIDRAINNTHKIAHSCHVEIKFHELKLPLYEYPEEFDSSADFFKHLIDSGLKERYEEITADIEARRDYEFNILYEKGFIDYYLVVWDYVNYAKEQGIYVGPGRGSAAGSLLAYAIGITEIDPLKYDLVFERFLNPERESMPDFDIDFEDGRRSEVIEYVFEKYGEDHVAYIGTFGTLKPKSAIRDVARAFNLSQMEISRLSASIADDLDLKENYEQSHEFRNLIDQNETNRLVYEMALELEGIPRHTSRHAAGVVVSPVPIHDYAATMHVDGLQTMQIPMEQVEKLGFIKCDFLGLKTLNVIKNTINEVEDLNHMYDIPMDDPKVYRMLGNGGTLGVFQFESQGMTEYLKKLKPSGFEDTFAMNALYRPGPMDHIPEYITNKHSPSQIEYPIPALKPILEQTYGIIVYQEQVMEIFRELAGFSYGRADIVRRAMGSKNREVMDKEIDVFVNGIQDENGNYIIQGTTRNGHPEKEVKVLVKDLIAFSEYAFNKSHAVSYTDIAYRTAYLKRYYPLRFYAAYLNVMLNDRESLGKYIDIMKNREGVKFYSPDVNISKIGFSAYLEGDQNEEGLIFGLAGIDQVGDVLVHNIMEERDKNGEFTSFYNFVTRLRPLGLSSASLASLIKAGAFDSFLDNRNSLLHSAERFLDLASYENGFRNKKQAPIFDFFAEELKHEYWEPPFADVEEKPVYELAEDEKAVASIYLKHSPFSNYQKLPDEYEFFTLKSIRDIYESEDDRLAQIIDANNRTIAFMGMIDPFEIKTSKKGNQYAVANIHYDDVSAEVILFSSLLEDFTPEDVGTGSVVCLKAQLDEISDYGMKFIARDIAVAPDDDQPKSAFTKTVKKMQIPGLKRAIEKEKMVAELDAKVPRSNKFHGMYLQIDDTFDEEETKEVVDKIAKYTEDNFGNYDLYIYQKGKDFVSVKRNALDIYDDKLYEQMIDLLGEENVKRFRHHSR